MQRAKANAYRIIKWNPPGSDRAYAYASNAIDYTSGLAILQLGVAPRKAFGASLEPIWISCDARPIAAIPIDICSAAILHRIPRAKPPDAGIVLPIAVVHET